MTDKTTTLRDHIGQALYDYMGENATGNEFTIDPFDSRNIDAIADVVVAALAAQPAEPVALDNACMTEQAIDEYLSDYTMEGDSGSHTPDESELLVIKDAIMGLLVYPDFLASFAPPAPAAVPPGWSIRRKDKLPFKSIEIVAPTGHAAIVDSTARNPENILYMLADTLLTAAGDKP